MSWAEYDPDQFDDVEYTPKKRKTVPKHNYANVGGTKTFDIVLDGKFRWTWQTKEGKMLISEMTTSHIKNVLRHYKLTDRALIVFVNELEKREL